MALEQPPIKWCVNGWIGEGDNVSLVGPAKVGKSLLALEAAAAKATGTRFLGSEVAQGPVLYLDYENKPAVAHQTLRDMQFDFRDLEGALYYAHFPRIGPLDGQRGADAVLSRVAATKSELVVIDTVQRVLTGDENNSQGIRDMYRNLLMPLAAQGVAVLRLDHLGKSGKVDARGSSAKGDDVDQSWSLTIRRDGPLALRQTLSRSPTPQDRFVLRREQNPLNHVQEVNAADEDEEDSVDGTFSMVSILDDLELANGVGRPKASAALKSAGKGFSTDTLSRALKIRQARDV